VSLRLPLPGFRSLRTACECGTDIADGFFRTTFGNMPKPLLDLRAAVLKQPKPIQLLACPPRQAPSRRCTSAKTERFDSRGHRNMPTARSPPTCALPDQEVDRNGSVTSLKTRSLCYRKMLIRSVSPSRSNRSGVVAAKLLKMHDPTRGIDLVSGMKKKSPFSITASSSLQRPEPCSFGHEV